MQALADSHKFVEQLSTRQFIRSAYHWKFGKDISDQALDDDSAAYDERGKVPPYMTDYLLHIYGVH